MIQVNTPENLIRFAEQFPNIEGFALEGDDVGEAIIAKFNEVIEKHRAELTIRQISEPDKLVGKITELNLSSEKYKKVCELFIKMMFSTICPEKEMEFMDHFLAQQFQETKKTDILVKQLNSIGAALLLIPEEGRNEKTLQLLFSLFEKAIHTSQFTAILKVIDLIPIDERITAIDLAVSLFKDFTKGIHCYNILRFVGLTPLKYRSNFVTFIHLMGKGASNGDNYLNLIASSFDFLKMREKDIDAIESAKLICREVADPLIRWQIFTTIVAIPKDRDAIVKLVVLLCKDFKEDFLRVQLLQLAMKRPLEIDNLVKCVNLINIDNPYIYINIIHVILNLPLEQRLNGVEGVQLIYQDLKAIDDESQFTFVLNTMTLIPSDHRAKLIKWIQPIWQKSNNVSQRLNVLRLSDVIFQENMSDEVKELIKLFCDQFQFNKYETVLNDLKLLAPHYRISVLKELVENKRPILPNLLSALLKQSEAIRLESWNYLYQKLVELEEAANFSAVLSLSSHVLSKCAELMLHEDHFLYQKAIEVNVSANPEALKNRKNRYTLYLNLKRALKETKPLFNLAPEVKTKVDNTEETVIVNLEEVRKLAGRVAFTFQDLPVEVKSDCLENLFKSLEERLEKMPLDQCNKCVEYIESRLENSNLPTIKLNLLGRDKETVHLLNLKGNPEDVVDDLTFYFYTVMKALLDQDSQVEDSAFLSPQEEMLLAIASSIANCTTGQKDGIVRYYNRLPIAYRTRVSSGESDLSKKIAIYMNASIQKTWHNVLSDEDLLKELTLMAKLKEESHQTLYLKNLCYPQIGLLHSLTFDSNSTCVNDNLLDKSLEEILRAILARFPRNLLDQFKSDIAELLAEERKAKTGINFYGAFMSYFEMLSLPKSTKWEEYLILDEDDFFLGLTDKGALLTLKALQLIQ